MNWQKTILKQFEPKSMQRQIVLAIDPDGLLQDESLITALLAQNYDILPLEDEITFRYTFEREYRQHWDNGARHHLIVIVHASSAADVVPYDLYRKGEHVKLSVSELFPRLNAIIVRDLDNSYYADLYPAHQHTLMASVPGTGRPSRLSEEKTIEFILRVVFDLDPVAVKPDKLVSMLIKKHYNRHEMSSQMEAYLIQRVLPHGQLLGLTDEHIRNADTFYSWLGEQWQQFVTALFHGESPVLDFTQPSLRLLVDNLFTDGFLSRVELPEGRTIDDLPRSEHWIAVGLKTEGRGPSASWSTLKEQNGADLYTLQARINRMLELDVSDFSLREWLDTAAQWAEIVFSANTLPQEAYTSVQEKFFASRQRLDTAFLEFVQNKYNSISFYEDNQGPISLAKVNHWLRLTHKPRERIALVCFDGLAVDQWYFLRAYLQSRFASLKIEERRTYAIAPTVTPVSRQALFAGELPSAFAETVTSTKADAERWSRFWINYEVPSRRIDYLHIQVDGSGLPELQTIVDSKNRRLAIVVNLFDDVMHYTKNITYISDKRVYYQTLQAHLENGRLDELFSILFTQDYHVYLTSDHGNFAGVGAGVKPPKALVENYAQRVALFDSPALAQDFANSHQFLLFRTKFLPDEMYPAYAVGREMLGKEGQVSISHGGLSLEELIVPLVKVSVS
jgi:hypothetical protein